MRALYDIKASNKDIFVWLPRFEYRIIIVQSVWFCTIFNPWICTLPVKSDWKITFCLCEYRIPNSDDGIVFYWTYAPIERSWDVEHPNRTPVTAMVRWPNQKPVSNVEHTFYITAFCTIHSLYVSVIVPACNIIMPFSILQTNIKGDERYFSKWLPWKLYLHYTVVGLWHKMYMLCL